MIRRQTRGSRWWDDHMREILHGASTAFVLKGLGALLLLGVYVLLGRLLGPAESSIRPGSPNAAVQCLAWRHLPLAN